MTHEQIVKAVQHIGHSLDIYILIARYQELAERYDTYARDMKNLAYEVQQAKLDLTKYIDNKLTELE